MNHLDVGDLVVDCWSWRIGVVMRRGESSRRVEVLMGDKNFWFDEDSLGLLFRLSGARGASR